MKHAPTFFSISLLHKARRVIYSFFKIRFSARSRVAAGPTRSGIRLHRWRLRRLLTFHTLVGYCCWVGCRVTRSSIRSVTTKRKSRSMIVFPKDSEERGSRGNSKYKEKKISVRQGGFKQISPSKFLTYNFKELRLLDIFRQNDEITNIQMPIKRNVHLSWEAQISQ